MGRLTRWSLYLLIAAPAVFLLVAIQTSAITVPFWDHCEMISVVSDYLDGNLKIADLWRPHNQHRPFTYRLIYLINAVLTNWDIRSEYLIHISIILAAFGLQAVTLWRICDKRTDTRFLLWLSLLSILAFSPVGHNNHWWSMMTQLNLAHLLILAALIQISFNPGTWQGSLPTALACWLATYTLANGLVAFVCCAAVAQYASERPWRPSRWTAFWIINLILVHWLYFPGISHGSGPRPGLMPFIRFSVVYLGAPLRGLIQYPYRDCLHLPLRTIAGGITGVLLLIFASALLYAYREQIRRKTPAALIFISFLAFAILSAFVTAWGRARFDTLGVSNANASRFTLFGGYFTVGLLFFLASLGPDSLRHPVFTRWIPEGRQPVVFRNVYLSFVILATISYARSVQVYRSAGNLNSKVIEAYLAQPADPLLDSNIFPNADFVVRLKTDLRRHHLGPYRDMAQAVPIGPLVLTPVGSPGSPHPVTRRLTGDFACPVDLVTGIDVFLYTYAQRNSGYCQLDVLDEAGQRLAWSRVDASVLLDGAYQTFAFNDLADVRNRNLKLALTYQTDPRAPGTVAVLSQESSRETFRFRVRGTNDPVAEFARSQSAAQK